MGPTALSWVLPRTKTCCFLTQQHIIQCLVPSIPPAGSPIPWHYVLGTQPANITAKLLTFQRKEVLHLHSKALPEDWLLEGTTLPWYVRNYSSNDAASYPRISESSATCCNNPVSHNCCNKHVSHNTVVTTLYLTTLLWQPCISQHCCDNPVSHNTVVTTLISQHCCDNPVSHNTVVTTLISQHCISQHCCDNPVSHIFFTSTNFPAHDITLHFTSRFSVDLLPLYLSAADSVWWWTWQAFTKIILLHDSTAAVYNFCIRLMLEVNFWQQSSHRNTTWIQTSELSHGSTLNRWQHYLF
jgi:hypothetical protein